MPNRPRFFAAHRLLAISFLCLAGAVTAMAAPTNVWVDAAYTSSGANDGHTWQTDAFDKLQDGIDGVADGGTVYVHAGDYKGAKATKSVNIKCDSGAVIHGASPALTISTTTTITGGTWLPSPSAGNDPTILIVTGGNLTLRGATVVESSGFAQSCIQIDDGTLNAGTTGDPGANIFQITGAGRFITNNTATAVSALGNTWKQDATAYSLASLADNFAIEDRMYHALDDSSKGLITWIANNTVYVTPNSGAIQRGISAASANWTINVDAGTFSEIGQLDIAKNLTIVGAGIGSTIVKPTANTGNTGDPRGWWLVESGITLNLSKATLDGTGFLVWQAIRHHGVGTIDQVRFTTIQYNQSGPDYAGTAIAAFGGVGAVDVSNSQFDAIGRVGVLYFGSGSTGTFANNTYTGKGGGDWLDYALDIDAGAVVTVQNNVVSGNKGVASVDNSSSAGFTISTFFGGGTRTRLLNNYVTNNTDGVAVGFSDPDSSLVFLQGNDLRFNTNSGLSVIGGAVVDAGQCGAGTDVTGYGVSTGGNNLTGYGFDNAAPWAIENFNASSEAGVLAFNNNFGAQANVKDVIRDGVDDSGASSLVSYSQSGALYVSCPANTAVQCLGSVPTGAADLAAFNSQGGAASASSVTSFSFFDDPISPGPEEGIITRHYSLTDTCGQSTTCNQTITVNDTVPPLVSCKNITVNLDSNGNASITPTDVLLSSSDGCPGTLNYSVFPSSFTCANSGANNVTLTVDDNRGNTNSCVAVVTVNDVTAPVVACGTITIQLDANGNYTLSAADRNNLVSSVTEACGIQSTNISRLTFNYCDYVSSPVNVNVTVTDIHNNTSIACMATVNVLAPPAPSVVYVDDDYPNSCAAVNFPYDGNPGPYYVGFNAFKTIQAAVNAVTAGGTVNVASGTYAEQLSLNKQVSLVGTNAGIAGYASRFPEAIIVPPSVLNTSVPREWDSTPLIDVTANGVSIDGFLISGDNPAIDGYHYAGMNVEAGLGVQSAANNVVFKNNILEKFTYTGFASVGNLPTPTYTGLQIKNNWFDSIHDLNQLGFGYAMDIQATAGIVAGNKITNTRSAMEIQPYQVVGSPTVVTNNDITVWRLGIYYNYAEVGASAWTINGNQIAACTPPAAPTGQVVWEGIRAETMRASGNGGIISTNIIDGTVALTDPTHAGWGGFAHAVWGLRYKGGASDSTHVFFTGNTAHDVEFGFVHDAPANIVFTGNSLTATVSDIQLQQDYSSTGAGLGTGGTGNVDATAGNTYDGVDSTTATLAQLYPIEDKVKHKVDNSGLGLVRVRTANIYVTLASGSIQRGIDAASVNDTVNVNSGTFTENVLLNKAVSLIGAGSGLGGTTLATAPGDSTTGLLQVSASGTLANPVLVKDMQITPAGRSGFSVGRFLASDGVSVDYLTLNNVSVIGDNLNPCSEQERGLYVDLTSSLTHLTVINCAFDNLHYGWYLQKAVSADTSTVQYVLVTGTTFNHNNIKGLYAEKLSDASFSCCVIGTNGYDSSLLSGCSFFVPNMAGFDINLKAGTYANLSVANSDFLRNALGVGAANGIGLAVKGRGTGGLDPSYASFPGLVSGISVAYCNFDSNQRGIRFGEPGKGNTTPTSVSVLDSSFTADASGGGLDNQLNVSAPAVNAVSNWWGSATGPSNPSNAGGTGEAVTGSGLVAFNPWLGDSTDTLPTCGFQPNPAPIYYLPHHLTFFVQPGGAGINSPLSPQPVVRVIDSNGGVDTVFNGTVTVAIANNPSSGTLAGTATIPVVNGVAAFSGLSIDHAGAGYTLLASSQSPVISATSDPFDIANSAPTISTLVPSFAVAGDPGFTLTVNGANFVYNSVVRWAGSIRSTTYVSPSQVTASISMADIASTGFFNITVSNAAPGGGESAPASFEVKSVPTVVYVDDDFTSGSSGGHIWNYDAFNTVQAGITRVAANGTVYVAAGSYTENVTANKAVNLLGANQGVDGCASRGPESTISGGAGVAVNITSDNVTVDGFALTGATGVRDLSKVGVAIRNNAITAGGVGADIEQILTAASTVTLERNCISLTTQVAGSTPTIGVLLAGAAGPLAAIIQSNGVSGAFYGYLLYSLNASVPTAVRGGTVTGVKQGVALINVDPQTFSIYSPSTFVLDGLAMSGFTGDHPANPNNNLHAGVYVFTGGSSAANKISGSISNLAITGTGKISPDSSGMDFADFSTASGVMQQIDVSNCSVNTNYNRGIFASGANAAITVTRSSVIGNGYDPYVAGGNPGFGVIARNKANLNVSESFIENPVPGAQLASTVYAVECDANTPALGPTLTVLDCSINDHGNGLSAKQSDGILNASGNWWASSVALTIASKLAGIVDYTPYLDSGTDTNLVAPGFQGDFHTLHVVAASPQTGPATRIQEGIDMTAGSTVIIEAGNYAENILANKDNIELAGVGQALVTIVPAVSAPNPCAGSSLCGGAASSIILVQANNVKIHDVTLDGDNPSLSGVSVGGADIDARNGIIEDFSFGPGIFNGTEVYNTTVRNVFLRAIYASSGGSGFSFHNNTVQNVQGEANSVGIFNFGGSGLIAYNNVQNCGDAIAANHSRGTQFMTNTVSSSGSGVHTDNAGDGGGSADLLQGNVVTSGTAGAYGVWVFAPYIAPTVNANTISGCAVGLASAGQGAAVTPVFSNNSVSAGQAGSYGAYETTSLFGFGSSAVSTLFQGNDIQGTVQGVYLEAEPSFNLAAVISANNSVKNNQYGVYATGAGAKVKVENGDLRNNAVAALHADGGATLDAGNCTVTDVTGLGQSTGGNNLSGYGFDNASPFAAENLNGGGSPAIYAYQDIYGALAGDNLARLFSGTVLASQSGGLLLTCPGPVNIQCLASVPAAATDLAGFIAQGGTASATVASISNYDSIAPSSPNDRVITRQYTLTDACGQVAACNQIITVDDTIPPVVGTWPSPPASVTVNGVCQAAIPDLRPQVSASDNCGALHTNQSPSAGTLVGPGNYTIYVSVSDDGGNSVTNVGISFTVNAGAAPADVYVDDGYVGLPTGTSVDWPYTGSTGSHYIGCDAFATIQGGYARVDSTIGPSGGNVHVAAGNYAENISITKRVNILGAKAGIDARGRVIGPPNPAVESIVTSGLANSSIFDLNTGCALSVIDGLVLSGGGGSGTVGAIRSSSNPIDQVQLLNNHFTGFLDAAVWFNRGGTNVTVSQNVMDGSGMTAGSQIIFLNSQNFPGLWVVNNWIQNGGSGHYGLFVDGTRNVNPSDRVPQIVQNVVSNNSAGMNIGSQALQSAIIALNTFANNASDGIQGGPRDSMIFSNRFVNNQRWGLALTSFGSTSAGRGASNDVVVCNTFSGNGFGTNGAGGGILFSTPQPANNNGSQRANFNNISGNLTGVSYGGTEIVNAMTNWWGSATGPTVASNPGGVGDSIAGTGSANVLYNPYLSADTSFPYIACPNNITTVTDPSQCTAVVTFAPSAVSTCCSGPIPITSIPASGFAFPVGTTVVTSWATNACGNVSSCSFTVTVNDNQAPTISSTSATEAQPYIVGPVNVKNCAASTVQGVVNISVVASDQCPLSPPTINLTNGASFAAATFVNQSPLGTYNYTWTVGPSTDNGTWTATVAASDTANTTISTFTLCVDKSQITGALQMQGFIGTGTVPMHTRTVTFVATDGPGGGANVLKTWTVALSNVSGDTFSYTLTGVPAGTLGLSAKTDWHLRRKLPVTLDVNGQAVENFSGASQLNGGDISASNVALRDNQVQLFDYLRLLNDWHTSTSVADIDGNGQVSTGDYNILSANWFTSGDPQ